MIPWTILVIAGTALGLVGCGHENASTQTQVTSASLPVEGSAASGAERHACEHVEAELQSMREREGFEQASWEQLGYVDDTIGALEARRASTSRPAVPKRALGELHRRSTALGAQLRALPGTTDEEWPGARRAIESAFDEVERALVEATWSPEP